MTSETSPFFSRQSTGSVEQTIAAVESALQKRQFSVLWHLDINQKLEEKGFERGPAFHVLEVCSAPRAKRALTQNQLVGYFLPCKIVVYEEDGGGTTRIGMQPPRMMVDFLGDQKLEPLAKEVETLLIDAIAEAAAAPPAP